MYINSRSEIYHHGGIFLVPTNVPEVSIRREVPRVRPFCQLSNRQLMIPVHKLLNLRSTLAVMVLNFQGQFSLS